MYVEYTELWTFLEKLCMLNIQNCVYSLKKSCTFIEKLWTLNIFNILYYFKNCIPKIYKIVNILVDIVFCSILIHASKSKDQKKKEKKKRKGEKSWISKPKRLKINTCLNGESKSHNIWKTHFYRNSYQKLN